MAQRQRQGGASKRRALFTAKGQTAAQRRSGRVRWAITWLAGVTAGVAGSQPHPALLVALAGVAALTVIVITAIVILHLAK